MGEHFAGGETDGAAPSRRSPAAISPYLEFNRAEWSALSKATPLPLTDADVKRLRGLGDPIDLAEVDTIYRPLSRLLNLYINATGALHQASLTFLGDSAGTRRDPPSPYVIAIAGSVAVGKSTVARILRELLARWPDTPHVELVTTDGFLYPNAELERRGLMSRKGFPESYDQAALLKFVQQVKAGEPEVKAPVYSHVTYDIVAGEHQVVHHPDVLILEGLDVLEPARPNLVDEENVSISDFFDFSIYVDARTRNIRRWYVERFLELRKTAFHRPDSYFRRYADLSDDQAIATALSIWETINAPNLEQYILPTRGRATLILEKGADHKVQKIKLRKL